MLMQAFAAKPNGRSRLRAAFFLLYFASIASQIVYCVVALFFVYTSKKWIIIPKFDAIFITKNNPKNTKYDEQIFIPKKGFAYRPARPAT